MVVSRPAGTPQVVRGDQSSSGRPPTAASVAFWLNQAVQNQENPTVAIRRSRPAPRCPGARVASSCPVRSPSSSHRPRTGWPPAGSRWRRRRSTRRRVRPAPR